MDLKFNIFILPKGGPFSLPRLYKYKASFISGALRALQFCEALACGALEVRKLRGEVEKSVAKLDDTMHTMAVQIVQIVHTQSVQSPL